MFMGMQEFDFAQIQSNLPKSDQICPNLTNFARYATAFLASQAPMELF